jgi:hypothetical protein
MRGLAAKAYIAAFLNKGREKTHVRTHLYRPNRASSTGDAIVVDRD